MVSQKSTSNVGVSTALYEIGDRLPTQEKAVLIARQLNAIVSQLIETDIIIDAREFDIWRGMAAGSQAQGSWQNRKGKSGEEGIRSIVRLRLEERGLISDVTRNGNQFSLTDGRTIKFASDPDIACYRGETIEIAIEIKGGIDTAGVHERYGAIGKSFEKPKRHNPNCTTILIIQEVSLTQTAREAISNNSDIAYWFTLEDILASSTHREEFLQLLGMG